MIVLNLLFFIGLVNALHIYMENGQEKCFQEDLREGTSVVCTYRTESRNDKTKIWEEDKEDGLDINVREVASAHILTNQRGGSSGRFTFTSVDSGIHRICLSSNSSGGWFSNHQSRVFLDIMFGDPTTEQTEGKQKVIDTLVTRIREYNEKIKFIRKEQEYQREREAEFRDASEKANSQVFFYAVVQTIVLALTCLWQAYHLKGFFIKRKLV